MKSSRLLSTTDRYVRPALERSPDMGELDVRRVEALNAIEGDRQRSLRQEMREADPQGKGTPDTPRDVHQVVEQLAGMPPEKRALLTRPALPDGFCVVDEKA
ncbi:MAG: hypothetical protein CVU34_02545 [Betaproteobacteria bacterium HGW-Betaproteobacteria-7]|jgi:hypothetical protein|nr:MAG: hypothetical protein CVU34_02545 [Betaproteobacteria bacterium HGW-Betaproteobacteria-7]